MIIFNSSIGETLSDSVKFADTFFLRLRGLMFKSGLKPGSCLIIQPCNMIHTFFMKFPIDVVFVSHDDIVLYIIESMESFRVSPMIRGAVKVIELPAASVKKSGTKVGNQLKFMI